MDGTPFPTSMSVFTRWFRSKGPRIPRIRDAETSPTVTLESAYCAEIVAMTYQAMGLLPADRPPSWYDPGRFWSGDDLALSGAARLGNEIEVRVGPGSGSG
jgi:hypothetical protein